MRLLMISESKKLKDKTRRRLSVSLMNTSCSSCVYSCIRSTETTLASISLLSLTSQLKEDVICNEKEENFSRRIPKKIPKIPEKFQMAYSGSISYRQAKKTGMRVPLTLPNDSKQCSKESAQSPQSLHTNQNPPEKSTEKLDQICVFKESHQQSQLTVDRQH
jgi:hypothetical protein